VGSFSSRQGQLKGKYQPSFHSRLTPTRSRAKPRNGDTICRHVEEDAPRQGWPTNSEPHHQLSPTDRAAYLKLMAESPVASSRANALPEAEEPT
jgi:hypothetical protein